MNTEQLVPDSRLQEVLTWLNTLVQFQGNVQASDLQALASDASSRKYWRFRYGSDPMRYIISSSPPQTEKNEQFAQVSALLQEKEVPASVVIEADWSIGLSLQNDVGQSMLLDTVHANLKAAQSNDQSNKQSNDQLKQQYLAAIDLGVKFSAVANSSQPYGLPDWDAARQLDEMQSALQWFWSYALNRPDLAKRAEGYFSKVVDDLAGLPKVSTHFDLHCRNIMVQSNQTTLALVDYQDAVLAPAGLDVVSLLMDCYVHLMPQAFDNLLNYYHQQQVAYGITSACLKDYHREVLLCGLQRHTRILGTWCRLIFQNDKRHFLPDMPQVLLYLYHECRSLKGYESYADIFSQSLQAWSQHPDAGAIIDRLVLSVPESGEGLQASQIPVSELLSLLEQA